MWQYIYLIVHLRTMDETEMNGLESYLWDKVQNLADGDTSWFPQRKALALNKETEENSELQELLLQVQNMQQDQLVLRSVGTQWHAQVHALP